MYNLKSLSKLKSKILLVIFGFGVLLPMCLSQTPAQSHVQKKGDFEIQRTTSASGKVTVSFYDVKNNRTVKTLTQVDMDKINPFYKLAFRSLKQNSEGKTFSLINVDARTKREILNTIKVRPEFSQDNAENNNISYIISYPTSAIVFGNQQFVGLSRTISYFSNEPNQEDEDDISAPIGSQTDVLFLNAKGDTVATWREPYGAQWIASDDAQYALFDVGFGGAEGEESVNVALKIIDLQHGKQITNLDVVTQDPHYTLEQSYFKDKVFIRTYDNGSNKVLRLIINPYQGVAYYKVYEYSSAEKYNAGIIEIGKLSNDNISNEVRDYNTVKF